LSGRSLFATRHSRNKSGAGRKTSSFQRVASSEVRLHNLVEFRALEVVKRGFSTLNFRTHNPGGMIFWWPGDGNPKLTPERR